MKKTILSAVAFVSFVAVPFAQQQPAPAPKTPAHNVFALTGCLMAAANPTGAFKLTDVTSDEKVAPARAAQAGAVGTSGQKVSYELQAVTGLSAQGLNADALKAHAGHRVEVIVRPIESPATPASNRVDAARQPEPARERFTVTEIKRAEGRCS